MTVSEVLNIGQHICKCIHLERNSCMKW